MSSMNVLFVCMGNICRSPTAHGVFRQYIAESGLTHLVTVDSAGTHAYHVGEAPDARSQTHALKRGYDLSDLAARQLEDSDFDHYDLLLVMDWENYALTEQRCPPNKKHKIRRLTEFCKVNQASVVPDPYYKGSEGFEEVLDLVEDACDGLLDHVKQRLSR
jgi:protein-tyrosine phosphatase